MYPPLSAGLSFAPASLPGKTPMIPTEISADRKWGHLQQRMPTLEEIAYYPKNPQAIFIACGIGSGNLEVLDFDEKWQHGIFREWLDSLPPELKPSQYGVPLVRTMSGGYHIYYRLTEVPEGNLKLARRPATDDEKEEERAKTGREAGPKTTLETRGQGGFVIAPPSPGYSLIKGDIFNVPVISMDVRNAWHDAARALNKYIAPVMLKAEKHVSDKPIDLNSTRPGDLYEREASWIDILQKHGWHSPRQSGSITHLTRPGKNYGTSGIIKAYGDHEVFIVFSSNAAPFESEQYYTKLGAYTLLNYGGDFKEAVKSLASEQKLQRINKRNETRR